MAAQDLHPAWEGLQACRRAGDIPPRTSKTPLEAAPWGELPRPMGQLSIVV